MRKLLAQETSYWQKKQEKYSQYMINPYPDRHGRFYEMLFMTKSGIRKQVVQVMRPMLIVLNNMGEMPKSFWADPYLLGYIFGAAGFLITALSKAKYSGPASGYIMIDIFAELANDQGQAMHLARTAMNAKELVFFEGSKNAILVWDVLNGTDHSGIAEVASAIRIARDLHGAKAGPREVFGVLQQDFFYDQVRALKERE